MAVKSRAELIAQNTATFGNGKNTRGDDEKAFNLNHLDSFLNKKGDTLEANGYVAVQNGSQLKEGTNGGIALECIVGYDFQWKEGVAYFRPTNLGIVYAMSAVDQVPNSGFDSTLFYQVGSRFINLVTNVQYICTSATPGSAVWSVVASGGGNVTGPGPTVISNNFAVYSGTGGLTIGSPIGAELDGSGNASFLSVKVTGTNGAGHIHLRHQASAVTGSGSNNTVYALASGSNGFGFIIANAGYASSLVFGASVARTYTLPDASGTFTLLGNSSTGSGSVVLANTPTLITPVLGVATATSINGLTLTTSTGTLTIANGKTLTASNTLTFTGTDSSSVAFGAGGTVAYIGLANSWTAGIKQTFAPSATTAGINVGTLAGQPSSPVNGDLVYNSSATALQAYINGAWVSLGAGGGGGMAIGGSITSATAGSVLFAGTSGVLAQANSTFFWDNTNARLGIGFGTTISARLALGAGTATVPHFTLTPSSATFTGTTDGMLTYQNVSSVPNLILYKATIATPILTQAINSGLTGSSAAATLNVDAAGNITRGGDIQSLGIFSQITTVTITAVGSPTPISTLTGTLNGSTTLAANFFAVGKVITGKMSATLATGINAGNLTFRVRLGGVTICDSGAITYTISTAAEPITVEYTILCTAVGASGTAAFRCDMRILSGGALLVNRTVLIASATTSSGIATTGTLAFDLDANLSAAGNTLSILQNQLVNSN